MECIILRLNSDGTTPTDNPTKRDLTESETLVIGRDFGVITDIELLSDGSVFVVSLSKGTVYEIRRR